jgi:putative hydrolase of the HAD superfamily
VDYGGVLTTSMAASFRAFCADVGLPRNLLFDLVTRAYRDAGDGLIQQLETGRLDAATFSRQVVELLRQQTGVVMPAEELIPWLFAHVRPDERMLGAVAAVRAAGVPTALVSNSWGEETYPHDRLPDALDVVVVSGEVGLRKPDPAIFELACERLGVAPPDCVFVDDLPANAEAAEALGMAAVVHRDPDTTIPAVAAHLGLDAGAGDPGGGGGASLRSAGRGGRLRD